MIFEIMPKAYLIMTDKKQQGKTLDDLIATQTQKAEALKTHKKGLMQQLFPSPEVEA